MRTRQNPRNKRQGAMVVFIAVTLVLLLIAAAFSLDVAYMHMVRAELRTATDAAARAGASALAESQDQATAIQAAIDAGRANIVAGEQLTLEPSDISLGGIQQNANGGFDFVAGASPFTSVQVSGRRAADTAEGPVSLFFAPIVGATNFSPIQTATAAATVRDIALVLDRSGSMAATENGLSRIDGLKVAVAGFLDEINNTSPNAAISLTSYSTNATRDIELTQDFTPVLSNVNGMAPNGWTNISEALQMGSDTLEAPGRRPFAERTIVLMTDGNFNVGGTPVPSAQVAAARGHTIHTVTFSSGANQAIMQQVADIGGGIHLHADNAADLAAAFREIARTINVLLID